MRSIVYVLVCILFLSCSSGGEIENVVTTDREEAYDKAFREYMGKPSTLNTWGDWTLSLYKGSRSVNADESTWWQYRQFYEPSNVEDIVPLFKHRYDGTNMVNVPSGSYWVKTVYKNDYSMYTDLSYTVKWFNAYEKMGDVKVYDKETKSYVPIENVDSLSLIENLDAHDGVMPQFAYFNELFSQNQYAYRVIEDDGNYYVGFDFFADGFIKEEVNGGGISYEVIQDRDYIYDDWVMVLVPCSKFGEERVIDERRVICEDLSMNPDFDFNDLVYDVAIVEAEGKLMTRVTIQAVGTYSPIRICGSEAHELFGVQYGCINSGGNEEEYRMAPKAIYLDEVITDISRIGVTVFYENRLYSLDNKSGKAPRRICVDTSFRWCSGWIGIFLAYPLFKDYAQGKISDWTHEINDELYFK